MLTCPKCGQILNEEMFHKNRNRPNGYNSYCKLCFKEAKEKIKERYISEFVPLLELKCCKCNKIKPIKGNFSRSNNSKSGYYEVCYDCQDRRGSLKTKLTTKKYSEKVLLPRINSNIERVFGLLGDKCVDCGREATVETFFIFDLHHLIPETKKWLPHICYITYGMIKSKKK